MEKQLLRCKRWVLIALLAASCPEAIAGPMQDLALSRARLQGQPRGSSKEKSLLQLLKEIHKTYKVDLLYEAKKLPDIKLSFDPAQYREVDAMLKALLLPLGLNAQVVQPNTWAIVPAEAARSPRSTQGQEKEHLQPAPSSLLSLPKGTRLQYNVNADTIKPVKVSGRITDGNDGSPLPGTTVVVKGETRGTLADDKGVFSLETGVGKTLVVSLVGYETQEIVVSGSQFQDIRLKVGNAALNEIVVVGYGTQRKSLVTGAISSVKAAEIATVSSTRIEQALQGRTAGVAVLPVSGSPGSGMQVRIRGTGSNGSSQPLYIVDGMRAGGIEYLDPTEIASVEILKDAASAAIYGAEGANGVVIITTKTGKRDGSSEISYSMQYGQQSIHNPMELMNTQQYATYLKEANTANAPDPAAVAGEPTTNWMDNILQTAPLQRHALTFSGGTEKSTYLLSGTIFTQNGVIGGSKAKFDRYTLRINTDHKIKPWLTVGNRFSYSHFIRRGVTEDSEFGAVINNAVLLDPLTPAVYTGELPAHAQTALNAGQPLVKNGKGQYYGVSRYVFGEIVNPLMLMDITHNRTVQNKIVGSLYGELEPLENLKITSRFGIDAAFQRNHGWNPTYWASSERLNTAANVFDNNENWLTWQWENFATYQRKFNEHTLTGLIGMSSLKRMYNRLNGTSSGMFRERDEFAMHDFTPDELDRINGIDNSNTLISYYGRLSYDYKGKYLVNATLRRDGSSMLPPKHQWGTFPSVSVGWVLSNEAFFPQSALSYFKLRGSWGQNGSLSNLTIGQWPFIITSQGIRYPDGSNNFLVGAEPRGLENPDLKWETSEQLDIGADLGLFSNKLSVVVDYYRKTTKDLLTPGTPPSFVGNPMSFVNGGNVQNTGWEFELSYLNNDHAFKYEISGNLTTVKNNVTYLNPYVNRIPGTGVGTGWTATYFEKGYPIWYFRGYQTDGIFQDQQQIDNYLKDHGITEYSPKPGDPVVVDVNKDGKISTDDQTYIGSPHPKLIYGGRVNLAYKGFDLIVFVQGQSGNDILMGFNRVDRPTGNRPAFFFNDRWTGSGSTNTGFAANTSSAYVYNSDKMLFNGAYTRIRQLQLGYTLPGNVAQRLRLKNVRAYISFDDFFTFTKYPGMDPEAGSNNINSLGIDRGVYPIPRKLLGGITVSF